MCDEIYDDDLGLWADIPGRPNHEISLRGQIRNKKTGRVLKGYVNKDGYITVALDHNDHTLLHRLMCEVFFGEPEEGQTQVNHIDCNRSNNHILNLEWCTPKENVDWANYKGNLKYEKGLERAREVNIKPVRIVETGQVFVSLADCAAYLGVTRGNVSRVLSGERKGQKIHGFTIEYVREEEM